MISQKKKITTQISLLINKHLFTSLLILFSLTGFQACADNKRSNEKESNNTKPVQSDSKAEPTEQHPVLNGDDNQSGGDADDPVLASEKTESKKGSSKNNKTPIAATDNKNLIYGITIGRMDLLFKIEGKTVQLKPGAEKALDQIKKDGFLNIHMMQPFVRSFLTDFPSLPVQAVKLIHDKGFKVLLTIGESPFINGDTESKEKWMYAYFPGNDKMGSDDDGGLPEHKLRLKKFMDALKKEGLLSGMQFQLFDEPNAKRFFWGTFEEYKKLMDANIEVITRPEYGLAKKDILFSAFTSNLMVKGNESPAHQLPFWKLATNYKENPKYNQFPFSFNWYPLHGTPEKGENYTSADIKLKPMPEGSWITGMNVAAYVTEGNLRGKSGKSGTTGYRAQNTLTTVLKDIDAFAKKHNFSGIYIFNLITREDVADERGKVNTGLFNSKGCPRHEYKELLEFLNRPINFEMCPVPKKTDF